MRPDAQLPRPDWRPLGKGALVGKVGSVFTSTGTQHGGQEPTITSFHDLPYAFPGLTNMDEITGGSPYGAGTLAKADGSRQPSATELEGATRASMWRRSQGSQPTGIELVSGTGNVR